MIKLQISDYCELEMYIERGTGGGTGIVAVRNTD